MVTIEDSLCLIQWDGDQNVTGMVIGYYKEFDDLIGLLPGRDRRVCGVSKTKAMAQRFSVKSKKRILAHGAERIGLTSVNDEHHHHFYTQFGMYAASNLKVMGKHYV